MSDEKQPWYRWQFSLGTVLVAILLGWVAWDSITDESTGWTARVAGFVVFGGLAVGCTWLLWRNRHPRRFKIQATGRDQRA